MWNAFFIIVPAYPVVLERRLFMKPVLYYCCCFVVTTCRWTRWVFVKWWRVTTTEGLKLLWLVSVVEQSRCGQCRQPRNSWRLSGSNASRNCLWNSSSPYDVRICSSEICVAKKLCRCRGTSQWVLSLITTKVTFIEGHWYPCLSIGHMWFPISLPL